MGARSSLKIHDKHAGYRTTELPKGTASKGAAVARVAGTVGAGRDAGVRVGWAHYLQASEEMAGSGSPLDSPPPRGMQLAGSRPETPSSPAHSPATSSYSAFSPGSSTKLPPIHLSTVGRRELVTWINDVLDLDLHDIAEANNGAVACQMLDRLNPVNPEVVNMRRVDFNANSTYYMEKNWRILQLAFVELGIDWNVDIDKCKHGHQMDLLLLFRWFRQRFDLWEAECAARGEKLPAYDAKARRAMSKTGDIREPIAPGLISFASSSSISPPRNGKKSSGTPHSADDDSAREYGGKFAAQPVMTSNGTQMGATLQKGKGRKERKGFWGRLKMAIQAF